ncbi:hypothetical protein [Sphingosinicella sp. BN140058]|nr:hypothetical protein [Sphingosinicella sp. BN140058]
MSDTTKLSEVTSEETIEQSQGTAREWITPEVTKLDLETAQVTAP